MKEHTTPAEREILTHYWTTPGPFRDGFENWSEEHCEIVKRFLKLGLLEERSPGTAAAHLVVSEDALAAVPLPVRQWVIPKEE